MFVQSSKLIVCYHPHCVCRISESVLAVDFMEPSILENKKRNGHFRNVKFQVHHVFVITDLDT